MIRIICTKKIDQKEISKLVVYPQNPTNLKKELNLMIKHLINSYINGVWTSIQIDATEDKFAQGN